MLFKQRNCRVEDEIVIPSWMCANVIIKGLNFTQRASLRQRFREPLVRPTSSNKGSATPARLTASTVQLHSTLASPFSPTSCPWHPAAFFR